MKKLSFFLLSLIFIKLSMLMSNQYLISYYDTSILIFWWIGAVAIIPFFSVQDWKQIALSVKGQMNDMKTLQHVETLVKSMWVFIVALAGFQFSSILIMALADIQNLATLGTMLASLLLNSLYLLLARWFVFSPILYRLRYQQVDLTSK